MVYVACLERVGFGVGLGYRSSMDPFFLGGLALDSFTLAISMSISVSVSISISVYCIQCVGCMWVPAGNLSGHHHTETITFRTINKPVLLFMVHYDLTNKVGYFPSSLSTVN